MTVAKRDDIDRAFASLAMNVPEDAPPEAFLHAARELMRTYGGADSGRIVAGVTLKPVVANGVPAEWIIPPTSRRDRRLVYLHGGGFISGGLEVCRPIGAVLAAEAECPVLLVDYRLAPENRYPAPLDDCAQAYLYACTNGPGGEAEADVCLVGDSAGGNLAAALTVRLIEGDGPPPARIALFCGALDPSHLDFVARHDPLCTPTATVASFAAYVQGAARLDDSRVAPVNASTEVFEAFPPTLLQVGTDEFLLESTRRFSGKLIAAGRRCIVSTWPLVPHVWHYFVDVLPESREALEEAARFLKAGSPA